MYMAAAFIMASVSCTNSSLIPTGPEDSGFQDHALYYSAVEYDSGYDWKKDSLGGAVDSRLVLYREGKRIAEVEISAAEHLSSSGELHRICEGALYSSHEVSGYTIIRRNGEYAAGWEGKEILEDLLVISGNIHTLSSWPGGTGLTYRVNDKVVLQESDACVEGTLYLDNSQVCFAYSRKGGAEKSQEYFICADGTPEKVVAGGGIVEVMALHRYDGKVHLLAKETDIGGLVWSADGFTRILEPEGCTGMRDCGFIATPKGLVAHFQGKVRNEGWNDMVWNDFFWNRDGMLGRTTVADQVVSQISSGGELCYATSPAASADRLSVVCGDKTRKMPENYFLLSPYAICATDSGYAMGVNDAAKNNRPVLINGADTQEMDFNGYFTRFVLP